jgi:hypothetical protein
MGWGAWWVLAACICCRAVAGTPDAAPELTAEQIVEKNVAARGGLEAWRDVETMVWIGHVETGTATGTRVPFVLEMKRPNKTRFTINAPQQVSMRMFDGKNGWKLRSTNSGQQDLQPYSADEAAFALDGQVIEGPLMDWRAKGSAVVLEGVGEIAGSKAYRLGVKLPSGASYHVWLDARSFLEIRSERESRNAFGRSGSAARQYRNYHSVDGLQIPFLIENNTETGKIPDRMVIDRILLNPPLEDQIFAKPLASGRKMLTSIDGDTRLRVARPPGPNPGSMPDSGNAQ